MPRRLVFDPAYEHGQLPVESLQDSNGHPGGKSSVKATTTAIVTEAHHDIHCVCTCKVEAHPTHTY